MGGHRWLGVAAVAALAGCNSAAGPSGSLDRHEASLDPGVVLSTDRDSYRLGDDIALTLTNGSDKVYLYTFCPVTWDTRRGGDWRRSESLMLCPNAFGTLEPGSETRIVFTASDEIGAGIHRLVARVRDRALDGDPPFEGQASNPFTVTDR